jgi:hypothetical protein
MRILSGTWRPGPRRAAMACGIAALVALAMTTAAPAMAAPAFYTGGWYGLRDAQTDRCLDSNAAGAVYTNPCQVRVNGPDNSYQIWDEVDYRETVGGVTYYVFALQDDATGWCLDSNASGKLYTRPCQAPGNLYQDWNWDDATGTITDYETGRCLDSNSAGQAYTLPCNGGGYQLWVDLEG